MRKALNRVGQSTLEYVIVLTAIVAAILFAAAQFIKPSVNKVYSDAGMTLNASGDRLLNGIGGGVAINATTTSSTTSTTTSSTTSTGW